MLRKIHQWSHVVLGFFFTGRILITDSIFLLVIGWEELRATLSFGYELIPCLCIAWKISMPDTDFALGMVSSPSTSWLKHCWAAQLPGVISNTSSQMELKGIFQRELGCDSATCLGSRMVKLFILWSKSHRFASWHFLRQIEIWTWFCRWAKLLIGIKTLNLQVWIWSAKIHVLVIANPSPLLCHRFPVIESHRFPCNPSWRETKVRAPTKWPTMLGETGFPTLTPSMPPLSNNPVLFFHWRRWRFRKTSQRGAVLCWGRGNAAEAFPLKALLIEITGNGFIKLMFKIGTNRLKIWKDAKQMQPNHKLFVKTGPWRIAT